MAAPEGIGAGSGLRTTKQRHAAFWNMACHGRGGL